MLRFSARIIQVPHIVTTIQIQTITRIVALQPGIGCSATTVTSTDTEAPQRAAPTDITANMVVMSAAPMPTVSVRVEFEEEAIIAQVLVVSSVIPLPIGMAMLPPYLALPAISAKAVALVC